MNQLGYFTLGTVDIAKAKAFYGALFGWTFDDDASNETYAHVAGSDPACGFTKVERTRDHADLYFRVEDIDAMCAEVNRLGGRAALPSDSDSGRSVSVCDDQGMSFSLWQPAAGLVD
ncbi:MAG: bleomycin resistance protein [Alphaproteobacteria bacterium]|nr:bleomycin resistance protein [Alphaproteobacteria bacterium]MBU2377712.1 bleomycin resistance protein [Alphaproteobacteria bacterium]